VVPKEVAASYREQMQKPDLVFITKENEAAIATEAAAMANAAAEKSKSDDELQ
jgi:hypothetical protein